MNAAGAAGDHFHVIEPEAQQHGLLQPLIDLPGAVFQLLGDANRALVEQVQSRLDGIAHRAFGVEADLGARLEGVFNGLGEI